MPMSSNFIPHHQNLNRSTQICLIMLFYLSDTNSFNKVFISRTIVVIDLQLVVMAIPFEIEKD